MKKNKISPKTEPVRKVRKIKKTKKKSSRVLIDLSRGFLVAEFMFMLLMVFLLIQTQMIPFKYMIALVIGFIIIFAIQVVFLFLGKYRKAKKKFVKVKGRLIASIVLSVMLMSILGGAMYYIRTAYQALVDLNDDKTYAVIDFIVLNTNNVETINDCPSTYVAGIREFVDEDNTRKAITKVKEDEKMLFEFRAETYSDFGTQLEDFYSGKIDMLVINDTFISLINDEIDNSFISKIKVIHQVKIEVEEDTATSVKDVTSEPFNILISGLDNSGLDKKGNIKDTGLSDVNILVTVNPITRTILMTNIPRDYYVPLNGDTSKMDKLTHAGIYGIDCSMNTVGKLLDMEIDYYVKVGFYSVIDIVDAVGGVTIDSPYSFKVADDLEGRGYINIKKGKNTLDGLEALQFSRYRSGLPHGDNDRGKNQQLVIKAVIEKIMSPSILANFSGIMSAVSDNCKMSLTAEDISKLVQMQLAEGGSWDIQTTSVTGSGSKSSTYSYGSSKLYVTLPSEKSINAAKEKIQNVMNPPQPELESTTNKTEQ